jgi:hypothetical protein
MQAHHDRYRNHTMGSCSRSEKIEFNTERSTSMYVWPKSKVDVSGWKLLRGNTAQLNRPNKILA